jgi:RNA polymerase sigma-70 factor (ECF subfamily)
VEGEPRRAAAAAVTFERATADSSRRASPPPADTDGDRKLPQELEQSHDAELARLAREGDEAAFAEIVRRHGPRVFRTASRFFRRREQVEDAAQEVFLKAFTQLDSYEGRGSFEGWLTRIATNTCLNILRGARRRPELTASDLSEDEGAWLENKMAGAAAERQRSEERGMVAADLAERVLETMSPDDRLVLMLMDGEEASVKEVAAATGWSESNVKVKAMRARRRMREAVEKLLSRGAKRGGKGLVGAGGAESSEGGGE